MTTDMIWEFVQTLLLLWCWYSLYKLHILLSQIGEMGIELGRLLNDVQKELNEHDYS